MRHTTRWLSCTAVAALGGLAACDAASPPTVDGEASLRRMASCDEVEARVEDALLEQMVNDMYGVFRGGVDDLAEDAPSGDGGNGGDTPDDFTTTNVQEQGVDELDLVKLSGDGTVMFVAQDRALQIVDAWPAEDATLLSTVELEGWAYGLFVDGDRAIVLHSIWNDRWEGGGSVLPEGWHSASRFTVVDVSDPAAPEVLRTVDVQGWIADARMIDGDVYTVLNQYMDLPSEVWDRLWSDDIQSRLPTVEDWSDEAAVAAAKQQARAVLRPVVANALDGVTAAELLPGWRREASADPVPMFACGDVYAPRQDTPLAMLSVVRYDLRDDALDATGLMSQGWTLYSSRENLYVAQSSRWWWGWDDEPQSHVHKFQLRADEEPLYVASGSVDGWMYDQFAMSEHDGFLRAVTTDFGTWWTPPEEEEEPPANHVFVLEDDGSGELAQVGHVGGIAPNEQVQAVRMMGEKGYVITFERTDPLFTLDLSDPTDPVVVGELHMPGFSAYLHPVGDDHLLGVGMQGLETGELTGLKINLFDVSDMADPRIADELDLSPAPQASEDGWSWSWSEALWDHHAFTYHRDTLTIPASMERWSSGSGQWEGFSGAISFHANVEDGLSELGRVDHASLVEDSECIYDVLYDWGATCGPNDGYWYARVRRSVYIEDNLFTISDYGVKVSDLDDPSTTLTEVRFYPE